MVWIFKDVLATYRYMYVDFRILRAWYVCMQTCMYVRILVSAYIFMLIVYFQCVQSSMPIEVYLGLRSFHQWDSL